MIRNFKNFLPFSFLDHRWLLLPVFTLSFLFTSAGAQAAQTLPQAIENMLQKIGLRYQVTAEPVLQTIHVPEGLKIESLDTLLKTFPGSQGVGYDMKSAREMHLFPLEEPWSPPENFSTDIPDPYARLNIPVDIAQNSTPRLAADSLQKSYGIPIVLDYRIDPNRRLNARVQAGSLKSTLETLQRNEGWQWMVEDSIVFLLPGPVEKIIGLPNWKEEKWIYADSPLSQVVKQLEQSFGVPIQADADISDRLVTGVVQGERLGDVLLSLSRETGLSFQMDGGAIVFGAENKYALSDASKDPAKKVWIHLEILEMPEKKWKELSIGQFLIQIPPPTAEQTEAFWQKVSRASGSRIFGKADAVIAAGTVDELKFPLEVGKGEKPSLTGPAGYFFKIRPLIPKSEVVQLEMNMVFRDTVKVGTDGMVFVPSLFEKPVSASVATASGKRLLVHGAIRFVEKEKKNYFLLSFTPEIVSDDFHPESVSSREKKKRNQR
jgi:hypothetical protein